MRLTDRAQTLYLNVQIGEKTSMPRLRQLWRNPATSKESNWRAPMGTGDKHLLERLSARTLLGDLNNEKDIA